MSPEETRPGEHPDGVGAGVLLVEDDPGYATLVQSTIEKGPLADLGFEHMQLLGAACDYVQDLGAGCVLLDLGLPDAHRLDGLEKLRAVDPDLPIVVLTGVEDDALAAEAVASGAQDYLAKGRIDEYQLTHAVRYAIERKRRERTYTEQLLHDPLTGLPAGLLFNDRLEVAISRAKPGHTWVALVTVEVHDLGEINDVHGHDAGDTLLRGVSRRLSALRPHDSMARDGNRFFVLFEDIGSAPGAMALAGRLGADLRGPGFAAAGTALFPQLRLGVAMGTGAVDAADLVKESEPTIGRPGEVWPPVPDVPPPAVGPFAPRQLDALRDEVDAAIESGLALDEVEVVLNGKPLREELRDAAWLYAWCVLERRRR
jgi:diguanylate cyclase (GGDEF)-like protein